MFQFCIDGLCHAFFRKELCLHSRGFFLDTFLVCFSVADILLVDVVLSFERSYVCIQEVFSLILFSYAFLVQIYCLLMSYFLSKADRLQFKSFSPSLIPQQYAGFFNALKPIRKTQNLRPIYCLCLPADRSNASPSTSSGQEKPINAPDLFKSEAIEYKLQSRWSLKRDRWFSLVTLGIMTTSLLHYAHKNKESFWS